VLSPLSSPLCAPFIFSSAYVRVWSGQIDEDDREKNTSLHLAAQCAVREHAVQLVRAMCELTGSSDTVDERNGRGQTPLHLAATAGNADVTRVLLDRGASRTAVDDDRRTALHCAAAAADPVTDHHAGGGGNVFLSDTCYLRPIHTSKLLKQQVKATCVTGRPLTGSFAKMPQCLTI